MSLIHYLNPFSLGKNIKANSTDDERIQLNSGHALEASRNHVLLFTNKKYGTPTIHAGVNVR